MGLKETLKENPNHQHLNRDLFVLGHGKGNCSIVFAKSRISDIFLIYSHRLGLFAVICLLLQQIYSLIIFSLWILFSLELPSTKLSSRKILLGKLIIL